MESEEEEGRDREAVTTFKRNINATSQGESGETTPRIPQRRDTEGVFFRTEGVLAGRKSRQIALTSEGQKYLGKCAGAELTYIWSGGVRGT